MVFQVRVYRLLSAARKSDYLSKMKLKATTQQARPPKSLLFPPGGHKLLVHGDYEVEVRPLARGEIFCFTVAHGIQMPRSQTKTRAFSPALQGQSYDITIGIPSVLAAARGRPDSYTIMVRQKSFRQCRAGGARAGQSGGGGCSRRGHHRRRGDEDAKRNESAKSRRSCFNQNRGWRDCKRR